jgi:hypothetical protein
MEYRASILRPTAALLLLLIAGCGSSGDNSDAGDLGAGFDGGDDLSAYVPNTDAGPLECGMAGVCGSGKTCCIATPPDGGAVPSCEQPCSVGSFPVSCAGPGYCGGLPCCLHLTGSKPTDVSCTAADTECEPNINIMGNGVTRACDIDGDCTNGAEDTMFNQCCHLVQAGYKICFNSAYVSITKGAIACP